MNTENTKPQIPPYAPFQTLKKFILGFQDQVLPSHIDKSVMSKMSGSTQASVLASIKAMSLIDSNYVPTDHLKSLVSGSEETYQKVMRDVVHQTYGFLFTEDFDIRTATSKMVEDKFRDQGAKGQSTLTKCISFFLSITKDAGVEVSEHVKAPKTVRSTKKKVIKDKVADSEDEAGEKGASNTSHKDMDQITVPLRNMEDGQIYFPKGLSQEDAKKAAKMAVFIINNFYGIEDD